MKRVLTGLAVAAVAVVLAAPASAKHEICVDHPRTPYPLICVPLPAGS